MGQQRAVNESGLKSMKQIKLPSARPPRSTQIMGGDGSFVYGEPIEGETIPGDIPTKEIPMQDFPKVVYLHPRKPYRRMFLPVDGHGNKEWQWIANEAKPLRVADKQELAKAIKDGYQEKVYIAPAPPNATAEPEEEPAKASA